MKNEGTSFASWMLFWVVITACIFAWAYFLSYPDIKKNDNCKERGGYVVKTDIGHVCAEMKLK